MQNSYQNENTDPTRSTQFAETGHDFKEHKLKLSLRKCKSYSSNVIRPKVVTDRNRLPHHLIKAPSTNALKTRLGTFSKQDMSI